MKLAKLLSPLNQCLSGMLRSILLTVMLFFVTDLWSQVSINTDGSAPDASAMLEVKSTTKGVLLPRLPLSTRPALPPAGLLIYQIDNGPGVYYFDGAAWQKMGLASYQFWYPNVADIYFNTGKVAIGTTTADGNGINVLNYQTGKGAVRGVLQSGQNVFAAGYLGVVSPSALGVPTGTDPLNVGVLGIKPAAGFNGAGVYGWNNDILSRNYAGLFYSDGSAAQGTNYGVYAVAESALKNYGGYFRGRVLVEGNSGQGSKDSTETLFMAEVKHIYNSDTRAVKGISRPRGGYGVGISGEGGWRGVEGVAYGLDYPAFAIGVYGNATGTAGTRIGIYGIASGGATNWAGYFYGSTYISSDLRIGTTDAATGYALSVNGKIACTEVLVQSPSSWPDYVFDENYRLMSLESLEQNIMTNKHLPGLPSAKEVESTGIQVGEMQKQVVQKIEELTLYTIEQAKLLKELRNEVEALKAENRALRNQLPVK